MTIWDYEPDNRLCAALIDVILEQGLRRELKEMWTYMEEYEKEKIMMIIALLVIFVTMTLVILIYNGKI